MPLLDHFHPPLAPRRHWESLDVNWAGAIADVLNETMLPEVYFAEEHAQLGPSIEINVATFADSPPGPGRSAGTSTIEAPAWAPPAPTRVIPSAFPDAFEVRVFASEGGTKLVAAIELVSPANKDRESHRRVFATRCAGLIGQGVGLVVIDIVTSRRANLHDEILRALGETGPSGLPEGAFLYAIAYRPIVREGQSQVEIWPSPLEVGRVLPTLPLALNAEIALPLDLEATYSVACHRRRLV